MSKAFVTGMLNGLVFFVAVAVGVSAIELAWQREHED